MPSLSQHQSNNIVKLLFIGDAKSGKTTALTSLVKEGYKLRILDFDNLLDVLANRVRQLCPDKIDNIEFCSFRDNYVSSNMGVVIKGQPKAWISSIKMLNKWSYTVDDGSVIDYGTPADWEDDVILVIDSLSRWCDAAYAFHTVMTPKGKNGADDGWSIYRNAQNDVEHQLSALTSPNFTVNVIVICHGIYQENPDGTVKIFPQGIGQKLSPKIPQYFSNYIRMTKRGEKRTIQLKSDNIIDLANTKPDIFNGKDLDAETGLAEFFSVLRNQPAVQPTQPKIRRLK